jgi:hypothetical protein
MTTSGRSRTVKPGAAIEPPDRSALMQQHAAAKARRDAAPLGTDEFRAAAEEVARIEVAIAELEEPPAQVPTTSR